MRFNPCFIGTYSFTHQLSHPKKFLFHVLILVLLELTLLQQKLSQNQSTAYSFNPCFIGTYSFTNENVKSECSVTVF